MPQEKQTSAWEPADPEEALSMRWALPLILIAGAHTAEVVVAPGRGLLRVEDGAKLLQDGDTLVIHPRADGMPHTGVALRITQPNITIRGVPGADGSPVVLSGEGGNYSGEGAIPRAIIEFAPEAQGGRVESLRLTGTRNRSHNGAGVRVNAADRVTIADCIIDGNDMGIMSNGRHDQARELTIIRCHIHHNGAPKHDGQSHNLYLGGGSARLLGCLIEHSSDGHNLKSRVHTLLVEGCTIRSSANRECDLVDAKDVTDRAGSLALFVGCVIAKALDCSGNRGVIHYGQDGGNDHTGTCWLIHCTVMTPFPSPVIELSAPSANASLLNTIIVDPGGGGNNRTLIARRGRGSDRASFAGGLWLSYGYNAGPEAKQVIVGALREQPPLRDVATDWRWQDDLGGPFAGGGIDLKLAPLPIAALASDHPLRQSPPVLYQTALGVGFSERKTGGPLDLGAFERTPQP